MSLKIVFAGTPDFAAKQLQALLDSQHQVVAVYTQPDRPAKRGKQPQSSAVKKLALTHHLPVLQPLNFKQQADRDALNQFNADVMVVVAYGLLLPESVLTMPKHGCINVHASLLPRWRGAAPIQRAIQAGDKQTGITIMQMDKGLDTGAMLACADIAITETETAASLHDKLAHLSAPLLLQTLQDIQQQQLNPQTQNHAIATYAEKLNKQEAQLNWQQSASQLELTIRAFNPVPMCYCWIKGQRLRVLSACIKTDVPECTQYGKIMKIDSDCVWVSCQQGWLGLKQIQLAGKRPMLIRDILNGQSALFNLGDMLNEA